MAPVTSSLEGGLAPVRTSSRQNPQASGSQQQTADEKAKAPEDQSKERGGILSSMTNWGRGLSPTRSKTASVRPGMVEAESSSSSSLHSEDYEDGVADYLDAIDPEVQVINNLTNIQNSIFVPHIPSLWSRRVNHDLPTVPPRETSMLRRKRTSVPSTLEEGVSGSDKKDLTIPQRPGRLSRMASAISIKGRKPVEGAEDHIAAWVEMDENERDELDAHVHHLLTRPQKLRRGLRGFGVWVRTPMGFIMLTYGILVAGWGTVIMLFIWKWIDLHDAARQRWWEEICDRILCSLFAAIGIGFAPFRAVDTYRMIHIAHFHRLSWKRRKQLNLPKLPDPNDLPRPKGYNEAFPLPTTGRLGQITEEESSVASPRERPSRTPSMQPSFVSSGPPSSHLSAVSSRDTPGAIPQAISNSGTVKTRRWWHHRSAKEKVEQRKAAMAALQNVEEAPAEAAHDGVDEITEGSSHADSSESANGLLSDPAHGSSMTDRDSRDLLRPAPPLTRQASIVSEIIKEREDVVVLTPDEQATLSHHQRKLHQSHSFYRYHETATHHAFPLDLLITIVCLLDAHSMLQTCLVGVTAGINYLVRPTALTAGLIACSLSCNAVAGFLIYWGGRKTKKTEEVERRLKIAIEEEAFARMMRHHGTAATEGNGRASMHASRKEGHARRSFMASRTNENGQQKQKL